METFIRFIDIWKAFGPKRIYDGLNLDIVRGETITIIGGSGTGKSVLLKLLIGLLTPNRGKIFFDGREVTGSRESDLRAVRQRIAMLFQSAALFDSLSVGDNVAYPILERDPKVARGELKVRVAEKLALVDLAGSEQLKPAELSGGMRKRVGLARALAMEPDVILYDEPTTGLDPINTMRVNQLIVALNEKLHVTSIVVTHDMESAYYVSDRIAMLAHRQIVAVGTVREIRESTNPDVQRFIRGGA
ncbi:MAG: ATP-binding cassette domain-containing protein [Deltaproteobacteria bacterium]|nr:ATP-binding cassette domain-containing protein [Deltaproteobacteria bacterium]